MIKQNTKKNPHMSNTEGGRGTRQHTKTHTQTQHNKKNKKTYKHYITYVS